MYETYLIGKLRKQFFVVLSFNTLSVLYYVSNACACVGLMFDYAYKQVVLFLSVAVHYDLLKLICTQLLLVLIN